ncbi:hypothetical protein B0H13DRAFT_1926281 [Mycena leptocephala]|nr:hypothetical protein B0H13DRAFT_1926281 [Mycena leptocephala]
MEPAKSNLGRHKKPHERPEVKILLREYRQTELHKRRPGRIKLLEGGAFWKWAKRTTNSRIRQIRRFDTAPTNIPDNDHESEHESDWSDESDDDDGEPMTPGDITYEDGALVIDVGDDVDDDIMAASVGADEETDVDSDNCSENGIRKPDQGWECRTGSESSPTNIQAAGGE